jgi:hypothetical protein
MIILGQVTTQWGIHMYHKNRNVQSDLHLVLAFIFYLVWIVLEVSHRQFLNSKVTFLEPSEVMTMEEFDTFVIKENAKLVILDDLVLDVS